MCFKIKVCRFKMDEKTTPQKILNYINMKNAKL